MWKARCEKAELIRRRCGGRARRSRRVRSPCRSSRKLFAFEEMEDLARPREHRGRQAREPANLDAVRAIGAARLEAMQEEDLVADFANRDVVVPERGELVGQLRQL